MAACGDRLEGDGMKTETILSTIQQWKEHPEKAQVTPVVTARASGSEAIISAGSFSWRADLPAVLGGSNQAPSPTTLLLSALAGCAVVFIRDTIGPLLNVAISDVRATARCRTDFRGLVGLDGAMPDLTDVELEIEISSPHGERDIESVMEMWKERCPVYLALIQPLKVTTKVEIKAKQGAHA
jgi:uncharacterized OsmC-like protein